MSDAVWWSQRFPAEGGAAAEGIGRQLGRPLLDPLTILVREAAQNSWDARRSASPVDFRIEIRELDLAQASAMQQELLPGPLGELGGRLAGALYPGSYVIIISDRKTLGLGGPTRADVRAPEGVVANFVQFMRNSGEASDHEFGGGTYGFGKGILYSLSSANTVLVDTHCADELEIPRRLMGASIARSFYAADETRFTGRHWWGDCSGAIPEPLLNQAAAAAAARLGLPGFDDGDTGTDIMIIGADLGTKLVDGDDVARTAVEAGEFIASSILWHLWPKFESSIRPAGMKFDVVVNGVPLGLPEPRRVPALRGFVTSMDSVHAGLGKQYRRTVAPFEGGELGLRVCPATGAPESEIVAVAAPFAGPPRHVARMRQAELVVDYFEGPLHPDPLLGYVGVFRASAEAEEDFAASEPPTHDAWVDRGLTGRSLGVVRGCRAFIRNQIAGLFPTDTTTGRDQEGLGRLASRLAGLAVVESLGAGAIGRAGSGAAGDAGTTVDGQERGRDHTGRREARARPWPTITSGPRVSSFGRSIAVVAEVAMPACPRPSVVTVHPQVVLAGGAVEAESPAGATGPQFVGWFAADSDELLSTSLDLETGPSTETQRFRAVVAYDPETTIRFVLHWMDRG